jgi:pimeloyl-ACP methyl ester carboxylesterase
MASDTPMPPGSNDGVGRAVRRDHYAETPNRRVSGANEIIYAYRDVGSSTVPLVLLQHFRGNLDNWDPALVDSLAASRRVIAFDNVGVGGTSGATPLTVAQMAHDALEFLSALELDRVDLLGFSLGSFVAQELVLTRPDLVRSVVLASSAPQGAADMHGWAVDVIGAVGAPQVDPAGFLGVFFSSSAESRSAGHEAFRRMAARTVDRDVPTTWQTRQAQYDAVCAWGVPNHSMLQRVAAIQAPVFVANGDADPMILPHYSYLLAGLIPQARLKLYPDAAHGFLFQHHQEFAHDVDEFIDETT